MPAVLFDAVKETANAVGCFDNMRNIIAAARKSEIRIFIVPHHRADNDGFENWLHLAPIQQQAREHRPFAAGTWGGEWHPDFGPKKGDMIVHEHWGQSGFANTDLDMQLKQHGIQQIILIGFIANSCIEATGRFGMELGYHITLVKDATGAFSAEAMHAAHEINGPTFAHAILSSNQLIAALPQRQLSEVR